MRSMLQFLGGDRPHARECRASCYRQKAAQHLIPPNREPPQHCLLPDRGVQVKINVKVFATFIKTPKKHSFSGRTTKRGWGVITLNH